VRYFTDLLDDRGSSQLTLMQSKDAPAINPLRVSTSASTCLVRCCASLPTCQTVLSLRYVSAIGDAVRHRTNGGYGSISDDAGGRRAAHAWGLR